jgi:hypothetical protein
MLELLGTVLTGGATGIIGSVIGKVFSFADYWVEQKKADKEHERTIEMLHLHAELDKEESERELAMAEANAASDLRIASYGHTTALGRSSRWVIDLLRLVRPILTFTLIILVGIIWFGSVEGRITIESSVVYMCSSSVLWWFGDRALRKK